MALKLSYPDLSGHPDFNQHEKVLYAEDPSIQFRAYLAVHNTLRGPARGGCRYWSRYANDTEAQKDVLRLSRGMTYKTALADLEFGGGKTVIIGAPGTTRPTPEIMIALGHALNELDGLYETGEDVGTRTEDFKTAGTVTEHVRVRNVERSGAKDLPGGPPLYTAYGVLASIKAAVAYQNGQDHLKGVRVAVKGLGNVAGSLCRFLHEEGAILTVADIDAEKVENAVKHWGARAVSPEDIMTQNVDVYAPCALGGDLNDMTIPALKATIVAGAANNQLARPENARMLHERSILYAPDYGCNAGGVINVVSIGHTHEQVLAKVMHIGDTMREIFTRSRQQDKDTASVADDIVHERLDAYRAQKARAVA